MMNYIINNYVPYTRKGTRKLYGLLNLEKVTRDNVV